MNTLEETNVSAGIYKVLSQLFSEPTKETKEYLEALIELTDTDSGSLNEVAQSMYTTFMVYYEKDLKELKVDYANLFIGPFQVKAPPYGSVYLEGHRQVMGESTHQVIKFYRSCGLHLEDNFKEPADHISAELEFIYYLYYQGLQTGDASYFEKAHVFIDAFMKPWIDKFTTDILQHSTTDFYDRLAFFTKQLFEE